MKLVFHESKFNRYSITALLASLERSDLINNWEIQIVKNEEEIRNLKDNGELYHCLSFFTSQLSQIREKVERLKRLFPESVLIAGGPHPSGDPVSTLKLGFDHVFVGEGEVAFPNFFQESSKREKIIRGRAVDIDLFQAWSLKFERFSPLEITRGCPYACRFCQTSYLFGTRTRHRSIDSIVRHVEIFLRRGMRDLRFITPNALSYGSDDGRTLNLARVEELLRAVKEVSDRIRIFFGTFPSEIRPEHLTEDSISLIKKYASNKTLTIGAQSGSDRVLERINRGHTAFDVYRAVELAVKHGFTVNVDFIFGLPDESEEEQIETVKFMEKILKLEERGSGSVKIHSHYFVPLSGTPYYRAKPSTLSRRLTQYVGNLHNRGKIFGQWHQQREYSQRILKI